MKIIRPGARAAAIGVALVAVLAALPRPLAAQQSGTPAFMIGADISGTQAMEDRGIAYSDGGVRKDFLQILKDHGFNWIRLRIFNDPRAPGAYSKDGYCDLAHTIVMAKRARALGFKFLLDFHYSDTWADPDKQWEPAAWKGLHGQALKQAVRDYTADVIRQLKAAGAAPDMVQVGNEIITGMVWPDGRVDEGGDWSVFAGLVKAGIAGVQDVDPSIRIMLHLALGGENHKSRNFVDRLLAQGVKFDVIGESYYPQWHGTLGDLRANLLDLATRYRQAVVVAEYPPVGPTTRPINDVVRSLPRGKGLGTFVWEGGFLFDRTSGAARPEIAVFSQLAADLAAGKPVPAVAELGAPTGPAVTSFRPLVGADASAIGNGAEKAAPGADPFAALRASGHGWVRLSLFNRAQGVGDAAWGDLPHTLALAKQANAAGLRILLDIELSDAPAGVEHQDRPSAWSNLSGANLERTVFAWTREAVAQLKAQGTPPDLVQVGDEISSGILRPDGAIGASWSPFGGLVRVASAGARDADPSVRVLLELATAGDNAQSRTFLDQVIAQDVQFDAIAFRYDAVRDGSLDRVRANLTDLARRYRLPIAIVTADASAQTALQGLVLGLPGGLGLGTVQLGPVTR